MSTTIDEKVVEMRFDNSHFEKNTRETISTLDKLKQKLNFSGMSKGFEEINTSANKVNMSGMTSAIETVHAKFSALEIMGMTALANIANSAVNAGKRIVSSLTIDPVSDGWGEYEMTLNAVQTTMAGTGKTAKEVEDELKKLDEYADKTVYSTADMLNNLPKFTNAGVELQDATKAMIGIANATALAGGDAGKASIAFYNLGQAIGTGYLTRMDYNSINNAGIATMEWKEQMIEAAIAAGTLTKVGEDQYKAGKKTMTLQQLFIDGLQEQWATTDVMMKVFGDYGDETTDIGKKSYAAAQDIKTFSMMMDSLKATAGTGWKDTWQTIFGGLDEAKEFWTGLTNFISNIITSMADFRNNLLEGAFGKTFEGLSKTLSTFKKPVEAVTTSLKDLDEIANEVIGGKWGFGKNRLDSLSKAGYNYYEVQNKVNEMLGSSARFSDDLVNSQKKLSASQVDLSQTQLQLAGSESDRLQQLIKLSDEELKAAGFTEEQITALSELRNATELTGLSVKDFIDNMDELDGRWLLINSFKNIGQGLVTVFNAIRDAWKEIFPPMTSDQLFNIIAAFHKFTTKLRVSEETADKIKSTFRGLFSILDIGLSAIKAVVSGTVKLISNFTGITGSILGATSSLGDWFYNLRNFVKESDVFGTAVDKIVDFLQKGIDKIKEFGGPTFKGFLGVLTGLWEIITKIGTSIGNFIGESLREGDLLSIVQVFNNVLFSGILLGINNFVHNLGEPLEGLADILESFQQSIQAKTLIRIAAAIGILALSLLLLSSIKPENLGTGITAMSVLFGELLGAMKIFSKIAPDMKNVLRMSTGLISLSLALLVLSAALKVMSTMNLKQMGVGLLGMTVALAELIGVMKLMPKDNKGKIAGVVKLALSLVILGGALKILATMSWDDIARSLTVMTVALGEFIGLTWALHKTNLSGNTKGMVSLAFSLVILGGALKILATMSWDDIGRSLAVMAGALGIYVALAWSLHATSFKDNTKGMLKMAFSLVILGGALKILATMSWDDIGRSLVALLGTLTLLVALTWAMHAADSRGGTALAMIGFASSLVLLGAALKILGSMSLPEIGKGLLAILGAFVLIGAAGYLLAPLIPTILGLAGAFALFGVGALAIGVGLGLIATGITALALAISTGTTAIVAGITAIIIGIVKLIPEIIKILGESIILLCDVLVEAAPTIAETILTIVDKILESLANHAPSIVTNLAQFLIGVLNSLRDQLPALIAAAVEVIGAFFEGIAAALKGIDGPKLLDGALGLTLLTALVYLLSGIAALIPSAMIGVLGLSMLIAELALVLAAIGALSQIPGLSWLIEQGGDFLQIVGTALGQFIGGIIGGVALGATSVLPQIGTNLSEFMENLQPFIDGAKSFDSSTLDGVKSLVGVVMALTGANLLESITAWVTGESSVDKFAEQLPTLGEGLMSFSESIAGMNASAVSSAATAAKALADMTTYIPNEGGVVAWFTGENSIASWADQLPTLGLGLKLFSTSIAGIDANAISSAATAAKTLADMTTYIPNEGGVAAWLAGENSIANFGSQLYVLGVGLKKFSEATAGMDVNAMTLAADAGKVLAEMTTYIPNEGGMVSWFTGENSMAEWAEQLPKLGKGLTAFSESIAGADVNAIALAATAAKSLADMTATIPNEGGMVAWFTGENSVATWANKLPLLGEGLSSFSETLAGVDVNNLSVAALSAKTLAEITEIVPKNTNFLESFGKNISKFAEKIKTFVGHINEVGTDSIALSINKINDLISMAQSVANVNIDSLKAFGDSLKKFAKDGVQGFVDEFSGTNPKAEAKKAVKEMIKAALDGAEDKKEDVKKSFEKIAKAAVDAIKTDNIYNDAKSSGKYVVEGFAAGISENTFKAEAKAKAMAEAALKAARQALVVKSPSRKFYEIGDYSVQGFVNALHDGLSVAYNSGYDMAESARKGLSKAVSKVSDIISSDINSQPTIRPVLDLSDVESGAGYLSSMFNDGPSVGVAANLRAISSGMNTRIQNGVNNDVVSAINKLRKDLGNIGGTTYNVNGITYDDGSNITDAVKTLIRAAKVERRV